MRTFMISTLSLFYLLNLGCGTDRATGNNKPSANYHLNDEVLPGGYASVKTNDPEVMNAAIFAVKVINTRSNSLVPYTLKKIVAAKAQVVAGMNYAMALQLKRGHVQEIHDVIVFTQVWTNTMELTEHRIRYQQSFP